jgi:hypothetical protein
MTTAKATAKASTKAKAAAIANAAEAMQDHYAASDTSEGLFQGATAADFLGIGTAADAATTDATTTARDGAIVPAGEATAISRWEALAFRIAEAEEKAPAKKFDYRDEWGNKAARSWVHDLRGIKGSIERHRKEAKAVHLERGRAVDDSAKLLEAAVQGLIEPHETAIKAIEAEEQSRIDAHRAVLDRIAALADAAGAEGGDGIIDVDARLAELAAIDTSTLEEFAQAGLNRQAEAIEQLGLLRDKLEAQESQRIELEALHAQAAAREDADRIARLQREAVEADRLAREAEAAARVAEAEDRARKEREDAATREAQALAQVEASRIAQEAAERRLAEEVAARKAQAAAEAERLEREAKEAMDAAALRDAAIAKQRELRESLVVELAEALATMIPETAATAIVDGTLHPAVQIDWALVFPSDDFCPF